MLLEILRDRVRSTSGEGFTSKRQLTFLSRAIEKTFDVRVKIAFRDSQTQDDIVAGLRAVLFRQYPDIVINVFASFPTQETALVWIEENGSPDQTRSAEFDAHVREYLRSVGVECDQLEVFGPALPEPSTVAILRSVKLLAPADLSGILLNLQGRGFGCPSNKWLKARLDSARKRGLVLWNREGTYSLTAQGIDLVPRSRTRSSSDIERILFLAKRRKW